LTRPPSGEQFVIHNDTHAVTVVEVGAGLRSYSFRGRPVLDGYAEAAVCDGARGQTLLPWPNRIAGGSYEFDGVAHQLALTEPDNGAAIHGLTRWVNWHRTENTEDRVVLRYVLHPQPGWPGLLECEVEYRLDDRGLTVSTRARNAGAEPCPYGAGAHPYLTVGTPLIDQATLTVPADRYYLNDEHKIPFGVEAVDGTGFDFREPRPLGDRQLDVAYTALRRDPDGRARARLANPDGPTVSLWVDAAYGYLEIFTGDSLPNPDRRRTGLGVEPMTCAPNAFRSGDGLIVLAPGQSHVAGWGIEPG